MAKDESPNSLAPAKVNVSKMSKKPFYIVLFAGCLMVGILIYSVNFAHGPEEDIAKTKPVEIKESEKPLLMGEGQGLSLKAPTETAVLKPIEDAPRDKIKEPLIIVAKEKPQPSKWEQEQENIRRIKAQSLLTALSAPLGVKRANASSAPAGYSQEGANRNPGPGFTAPELRMPSEGAYDPAADKDKEEFFARAQHDKEWVSKDTRMAGKPFEVKTGTVLPGIMVTGVNSDLPGTLIAQVSQNVYDTATGRNLLVPQGSKLYGVYDSRVIYGQSRVLVAWNRIIYPDGSAVSLGAMPGADMAGYAGFEDQIDNHYFRIFGSAVLMSLITGGTAYAMDSMNTAGSAGVAASSNGTSMQDEMITALSAQLGQAGITLLQKNLNIKPTLEIRPGYQFNLIVTKDIVFSEPYTAWRK